MKAHSSLAGVTQSLEEDTQAVAASCQFNPSTVSSAGHEYLPHLHSGRTRRTVVTPTHIAWRSGGRLFQRRSYAVFI